MVIFLTLIFIFISMTLQERVMYFHNGESHNIKQMDLTGIKNNPKFVSYDCSKFDCARYVKTEYPALFYWKGPGSAFERIIPHTQESVRNHFMQKQIGLVNKFRQWIEDLTLFQTSMYVCMFAVFLFYVFTYLFSPQQPKHKSTLKNK